MFIIGVNLEHSQIAEITQFFPLYRLVKAESS